MPIDNRTHKKHRRTTKNTKNTENNETPKTMKYRKTEYVAGTSGIFLTGADRFATKALAGRLHLVKLIDSLLSNTNTKINGL